MTQQSINEMLRNILNSNTNSVFTHSSKHHSRKRTRTLSRVTSYTFLLFQGSHQRTPQLINLTSFIPLFFHNDFTINACYYSNINFLMLCTQTRSCCCCFSLPVEPQATVSCHIFLTMLRWQPPSEDYSQGQHPPPPLSGGYFQ